MFEKVPTIYLQFVSHQFVLYSYFVLTMLQSTSYIMAAGLVASSFQGSFEVFIDVLRLLVLFVCGWLSDCPGSIDRFRVICKFLSYVAAADATFQRVPHLSESFFVFHSL